MPHAPPHAFARNAEQRLPPMWHITGTPPARMRIRMLDLNPAGALDHDGNQEAACREGVHREVCPRRGRAGRKHEGQSAPSLTLARGLKCSARVQKRLSRTEASWQGLTSPGSQALG